MNGEGIEIYGSRIKRGIREPRSRSSVLRHYYTRVANRFLDTKVKLKTNNKAIVVGFTKYGNRHLYSDAFGRSKVFTKGDLFELDTLLRKSTFVRSAPLYKKRKDGVTKFYYFKATLHGENVYLNIAEKQRRRKSGGTAFNRFLYSVTDKLR